MATAITDRKGQDFNEDALEVRITSEGANCGSFHVLKHTEMLKLLVFFSYHAVFLP